MTTSPVSPDLVTISGTEGKRPGDPCEVCGTKLRALFQSSFCPKDCDKPEAVAARHAADEAMLKRIRDWNTALGNVDPTPLFLGPPLSSPRKTWSTP